MSDLITREFARSRPHRVARELEKFTVDDIAGFLDTLDHAEGIAVLAHLSSRMLGLVLAGLDDDKVAGLLAAGSPRDAQAVIAHIPGDQYEAIIAAAPLIDQAIVQSLFGLPARTIAMQTTRRFIRVFPEDTCGEVLRELVENELEDQTPVIVTDQTSRYLGVVPLLDIMPRVNADRNVEDFIRDLAPLNADASVSAVLSLQEWDEYPVLPVVDDDRMFIGTVAIRDLRRYRESDLQQAEPTLGFALVDGYVNLCANLVELMFAGRRS